MRLLPWLTLAGLLLTARSGASAPPVPAEVALPRIEAVRLQLFDNKTGRFGDDVLAGTPRGLSNIGSGPQASNAALVVVELRGQPDARYSGRPDTAPRHGLRLVASERGRHRPLLDQTQALPVMGPQGQAFVAFLLHPGGCKPLRLSVSLIGPRATTTTEAQLPLSCGE